MFFVIKFYEIMLNRLLLLECDPPCRDRSLFGPLAMILSKQSQLCFYNIFFNNFNRE